MSTFFVANVLVVIVAARWLSLYDWMLAVIFAGVYAYLAIVLARWLFGRKNL